MARGALAQVLDTFGADYRATHALSGSQAKAWRAIVACRTAALGGHDKVIGFDELMGQQDQ